MANFKKVSSGSFFRSSKKWHPGAEYWNNFNVTRVKKVNGAVTCISFNPTSCSNFAVTSSSTVQIFDHFNLELVKSFSKFHLTALSGRYRNDGQLLVAGGEEPFIRLFNIQSKSQLRKFKGHEGSVHSTWFTADNLKIVSGSDDKCIKLWDLTSDSALSSYNKNNDFVRSVCPDPVNAQSVLYGSYDHNLCLHDFRENETIVRVDHGYPIEKALLFPTRENFAVSTGGSVVKVWDLRQTSKVVAELCHHSKTVMNLCFAKNCKHLLTASLDRLIKIYDTSTFELVHTLEFEAPILAINVSPDDKSLIVGGINSSLVIKQRANSQISHLTNITKPRQKVSKPILNDVIAQRPRAPLLSFYDKFLKKFQYAAALDACIKHPIRNVRPEYAIALIRELIRRRGFATAIAGRSAEELVPILTFTLKFIHFPRFSKILLEILNPLLDECESYVGESEVVTNLLQRLHVILNKEIYYGEELAFLHGMIQVLSSCRPNSTKRSESVGTFESQNSKSRSQKVTLISASDDVADLLRNSTMASQIHEMMKLDSEEINEKKSSPVKIRAFKRKKYLSDTGDNGEKKIITVDNNKKSVPSFHKENCSSFSSSSSNNRHKRRRVKTASN